jgi:type I restriction enzyme R subunit
VPTTSSSTDRACRSRWSRPSASTRFPVRVYSRRRTTSSRPSARGPIWTLRGDAKAGREIYFALYQALADSGEDLNGIFRRFDADFFDLVIVDECHRGSAKADTPWRGSLDHFSAATQLGRTATPKRDETADSYEYFGDPLFEYSLAQGIEDGFLAPYRVRRVVLSPDAQGWAPEQGQLDLFGKEIPDGLYTTRHFERVVSLLTRTEAAAKHLTE